MGLVTAVEDIEDDTSNGTVSRIPVASKPLLSMKPYVEVCYSKNKIRDAMRGEEYSALQALEHGLVTFSEEVLQVNNALCPETLDQCNEQCLQSSPSQQPCNELCSSVCEEPCATICAEEICLQSRFANSNEFGSNVCSAPYQTVCFESHAEALHNVTGSEQPAKYSNTLIGHLDDFETLLNGHVLNMKTSESVDLQKALELGIVTAVEEIDDNMSSNGPLQIPMASKPLLPLESRVMIAKSENIVKNIYGEECSIIDALQRGLVTFEEETIDDAIVRCENQKQFHSLHAKISLEPQDKTFNSVSSKVNTDHMISTENIDTSPSKESISLPSNTNVGALLSTTCREPVSPTRTQQVKTDLLHTDALASDFASVPQTSHIAAFQSQNELSSNDFVAPDRDQVTNNITLKHRIVDYQKSSSELVSPISQSETNETSNREN